MWQSQKTFQNLISFITHPVASERSTSELSKKKRKIYWFINLIKSSRVISGLAGSRVWNNVTMVSLLANFNTHFWFSQWSFFSDRDSPYGGKKYLSDAPDSHLQSWGSPVEEEWILFFFLRASGKVSGLNLIASKTVKLPYLNQSLW